MKSKVLLVSLAAVLSAGAADLTFENEAFRLVVGEDAVAKSLVVKATGEETLRPDRTVPLFSTTQTRPFDNEVKLAYPNKRTTYPANRLRREGDDLVVGFEIAPYEAIVSVKTAKDYLAFTLKDFRLLPGAYGSQKQRRPPVDVFRVLQLPVRDRANFGCWLGASWDEKAAVSIVGTGLESHVDSEKREGYRVFAAWAEYGVKLRGVGAALVAAAGREKCLDAIASVENDYGLPKGVESRRSGVVNASVYWTGDATPKNIDEHIRFAKEGGFKRMLLYYTCMCKDGSSYYCGLGDYDWRDDYPNREGDMKAMLAKVKAAGIVPGLHVLQTHVGLESRYVTPEADPRLNIVRKFTLAAPIGDDRLRVQEPTDDIPDEPLCRVLRFGTELIGFRDVKDGVFTGLERGKYKTTVKAHPRGEIGGLLDISEFSAHSCYVDQNSDLQDEIAQKIKKIYDCGFQFLYMDGSEGVDAPMAYNVARGQYRVWKALGEAPLFGSGAAKSHFGWHMLAGSNAFDIFGTDIFKAMIVKFPMDEAPIMRRDFTCVNFGWWMFWAPGAKQAPDGVQPDHWEYGTSRAAGWDCPMTVQMRLGELRRHPRRHDILETVRRWEDVRARGWLTSADKEQLKKPAPEHHLYVNERGEYELHAVKVLEKAPKAPRLRGLVFEREGRRVVALWHTTGEYRLTIDLGGGEKRYAVADRRYFTTALTVAEVEKAFAAAVGEDVGTTPENAISVRAYDALERVSRPKSMFVSGLIKDELRKIAVAAGAYADEKEPTFAKTIAAKWPVVKTDEWNGGRRTVFKFKGHEAWVVEPPAGVKAVEGRPWTWTMQWADTFVPRTGVPRLLQLGWHHVTIDQFNERMTEEGLKLSKEFQAYLVSDLGFAPKAGLIGMSWGGFFSVRYAAAYPELVKKIYLDAPLLTFYEHKTDAGPWKALKPAAGWKDDPEMPVNMAAKLAQADIPILLLYGTADKVVDPGLNAVAFAKAYEAAGGKRLQKEARAFAHHPHGVDENNGTVNCFFYYGNK